MTQATSATPDYTLGFSEEILVALRQYTAERNAAYLLPHLRPGQRLLDFGSGPGSISVGLANAVDPGELHGIDMEESQVEIARAYAKSQGVGNATFHVGDVTELPFEDGYFDVAHCHNVLMHVPDTGAVLAEVKRVMKPGGLIACREMIVGSSFTHPDFGVIDQAWDMFEDLLAADDGHPNIGKDLKSYLVDVGFENVWAGASYDIYSTPAEVEFIYGVATNWFLAPEITDAAIKYGASSEQVVAAIGEAYARWKDHPGAFCALSFGEVVGGKP